MNRLLPADLHQLQSHFKTINDSPMIRVVVLTADTTGQKHPVFCSGYDVSGFEDGRHDPLLFEQTVNQLAMLRPVVIMALNGSVYGGATDIVLACDLRIALKGTQFRMPACALGLHYYPSGLRRYVAALGVDGAKQAFLTGDALPVETLHRWGVFIALYAAEQWADAVDSLSQKVALLAPLALQSTKASLNELASGQAHDSVLYEREQMSLVSHDFKEGRKAFVERRVPQFLGH